MGSSRVFRWRRERPPHQILLLSRCVLSGDHGITGNTSLLALCLEPFRGLSLVRSSRDNDPCIPKPHHLRPPPRAFVPVQTVREPPAQARPAGLSFPPGQPGPVPSALRAEPTVLPPSFLALSSTEGATESPLGRGLGLETALPPTPTPSSTQQDAPPPLVQLHPDPWSLSSSSSAGSGWPFSLA